MAKQSIVVGILFWAMSAMVGAIAQPAAQGTSNTTVEQLDHLEQQRVILSKQLEVRKLQQELESVQQTGYPMSPAVPIEDLQTADLILIKVIGLASKPKAIFLYNGYRLTGDRGQTILPHIELRDVKETYVTLKDTTTGKESILWLSTHNG